jgi:hypothetical protein
MKTNEADADLGASLNQNPTEPENLTEGMLMQRLAQRHMPQVVEEPQEEVAEEPVEEEPVLEEETLEDAEGELAEPEAIVDEPEAEDELPVLSQLENMSQEELAALGNALKTKVPQRVGKLTARAKAAEEEAERLKAQIAQLQQPKEDPLAVETKVENNPFKDVDSLEGLQEQAKSMKEIQDWAEPILDDNEHLGIDDPVEDASGNEIPDQDGSPLTRRKLKEYIRNARKARETFLPARWQELQANVQRQHMEAALTQKAQEEFEWFGKDDMDVQKSYESYMNSPEIKMVSERVPEVVPHLRYILAHFADSVARTHQPASAAKKKTAPLKPPSSPTSAVGKGSTGRNENVSKQLKAASERFREDPSTASFVALRTQQRQNKQR